MQHRTIDKGGKLKRTIQANNNEQYRQITMQTYNNSSEIYTIKQSYHFIYNVDVWCLFGQIRHSSDNYSGNISTNR
jgi:hypothetical protein